MKIAVVGGGSTYTPELVDGLGRMRDVLPVDELVLVDPGRGPARARGRLRAADPRPAGSSRRRIDDHRRAGARPGRRGRRARCSCASADRRRATRTRRGRSSAAASVRRRRARAASPRRCARSRSCSTSPSRSAAAPDAWIIDFTNPVGIVTRALLQAGHRAVGLCNVAIGFQRRFAGYLGVEPDQVQLDHVGLNHLTWERAARRGRRRPAARDPGRARHRPRGGHRAAA